MCRVQRVISLAGQWEVYPAPRAFRTPSSTASCVASIRRNVGVPLSLASVMPSCIASIPTVICSARPSRRSCNCSPSSLSSAVHIARTRESSVAARLGGTPACSSLMSGAKSTAGERDGPEEVGKRTVDGLP